MTAEHWRLRPVERAARVQAHLGKSPASQRHRAHASNPTKRGAAGFTVMRAGDKSGPGPSNVESTFSMMKRKFGDSIRSKTDTAMVNEVLCKVLCHNLVVLIHEMYELGIDPVFWPKASGVQIH